MGMHQTEEALSQDAMLNPSAMPLRTEVARKGPPEHVCDGDIAGDSPARARNYILHISSKQLPVDEVMDGRQKCGKSGQDLYCAERDLKGPCYCHPHFYWGDPKFCYDHPSSY